MRSLTSSVESLHVSAAVDPSFFKKRNLFHLLDTCQKQLKDPWILPPGKVVPSALVRNMLPLIPSTRARVLDPSGPSLSYQNLFFPLSIRSISF